MKPPIDKDLEALYRDRLQDRHQSRTKRRRQLEAPPKRFGDLLALVFKEDATSSRRLQESRALHAWGTFVGEVAARFSQALRVRNRTLVVRVSDPLWMQQLCLLKAGLLRRYRAEFPHLILEDIYFTRG